MRRHGSAIERRRAGREIRAEGRRLTGPALVYGDTSPSHRERFEPGAFDLDSSTRWLNVNHDPDGVIAWTGGGGLNLTDGGAALDVRAELPAIPLANRALAEVRSGALTGFSVEFRAREERLESGIRVIKRADLVGIGLVRDPSYTQSRVEIRARSGRTMRASLPADTSMACACSGAECKFAEFSREAISDLVQQSYDEAVEIVAGLGSYSESPLASLSSGTLRLRQDGPDAAIEIDIPDSAVGAATVAAHEAAGLVVRPHLDPVESIGAARGETMVYTKLAVRGLVLSATDQRQGWPAPAIGATPGDLMDVASARAPRRRVWL